MNFIINKLTTSKEVYNRIRSKVTLIFNKLYNEGKSSVPEANFFFKKKVPNCTRFGIEKQKTKKTKQKLYM